MNYFSEFENIQSQLAGHAMPWMSDLRQEALTCFTQLGLPTIRDEDWKYTRVTAIERERFTPSVVANNVFDPTKLSGVLDQQVSPRLVFINGHYASTLSKLPMRMQSGISVMPLATALTTQANILDQHLSIHTDYKTRAFSALNTAFMSDGLYLHLAANTQLTEPLHLIFITTHDTETPISCHPRNVIIAEAQSEATILEHYIGLTEKAYFTNAVTEIVMKPQSRIQHIKLQQENAKAIHIGMTRAYQETDSHLTSHVFSFGAELERSEIHTQLTAAGANCNLNGLYLASGQQHIDHHTTIEHCKPHTQSHEYYKGIIDDHARAVFNGKVIVQSGAQHTDARQSNPNLLLSPTAEVNTKPQLEIYTDDVKCSHGATIGQLDENALFYLRSRGLSEQAARSLLIFAFANEPLLAIKEASIRTQLQNLLIAKLPAAHQEIRGLL